MESHNTNIQSKVDASFDKEPAEESWFQEESSNEQRNRYRHFQDVDRGGRLQHIVEGTSSANIARFNN